MHALIFQPSMWHQRKILHNNCQTAPIIFNTSFQAVGLEQTAVCGEIKNGLSDSSGERKLASEPSGYFMMPHRFQRPGNERWASWNIPGSSWLQYRREKWRRNRRRSKQPNGGRSWPQYIQSQQTASWSHTNIPEASLIHPSVTWANIYPPSLCLAYLIIWDATLKKSSAECEADLIPACWNQWMQSYLWGFIIGDMIFTAPAVARGVTLDLFIIVCHEAVQWGRESVRLLTARHLDAIFRAGEHRERSEMCHILYMCCQVVRLHLVTDSGKRWISSSCCLLTCCFVSNK